jgi:hypothetical protein
MNTELREFRRLERVCLEQAELSTLDLTRIGLLKVADDCRVAAQSIETQPPVRISLIGGVVYFLKQSLTGAKASRH